jgi:hypothetical protein
MFSGRRKKSKISDDKNIEDTITSKDLAKIRNDIGFDVAGISSETKVKNTT